MSQHVLPCPPGLTPTCLGTFTKWQAPAHDMLSWACVILHSKMSARGLQEVEITSFTPHLFFIDVTNLQYWSSFPRSASEDIRSVCADIQAYRDRQAGQGSSHLQYGTLPSDGTQCYECKTCPAGYVWKVSCQCQVCTSSVSCQCQVCTSSVAVLAVNNVTMLNMFNYLISSYSILRLIISQTHSKLTLYSNFSTSNPPPSLGTTSPLARSWYPPYMALYWLYCLA